MVGAGGMPDEVVGRRRGIVNEVMTDVTKEDGPVLDGTEEVFDSVTGPTGVDDDNTDDELYSSVHVVVEVDAFDAVTGAAGVVGNAGEEVA